MVQKVFIFFISFSLFSFLHFVCLLKKMKGHWSCSHGPLLDPKETRADIYVTFPWKEFWVCMSHRTIALLNRQNQPHLGQLEQQKADLLLETTESCTLTHTQTHAHTDTHRRTHRVDLEGGKMNTVSDMHYSINLPPRQLTCYSSLLRTTMLDSDCHSLSGDVLWECGRIRTPESWQVTIVTWVVWFSSHGIMGCQP